VTSRQPITSDVGRTLVRTGTDGGIVVDSNMRTNTTDVFAAGDCTEAVDFSTGAYFVNAIQPAAADQALVAALNMAGQFTSWQGALRMNVVRVIGAVKHIVNRAGDFDAEFGNIKK
jgi:NADPH-dependent 2,4-dienoyl-CoA reductase/sulfur reductase-like enzyme